MFNKENSKERFFLKIIDIAIVIAIMIVIALSISKCVFTDF